MGELFTRYVVAIDNTKEERKLRGFERRYVRSSHPKISLTTNCEQVERWEKREDAKRVADSLPTSFLLEWLLPL